MKNKKTVIALTVLLAVLALGIGYATITNITLNITGSTAATASDANFSVKFVDSGAEITGSNATGEVTSDNEATITVSGLTTKDDIATITYPVKNYSADLGASLTATVTENSNDDFFEVTPTFASSSIGANSETTLTVTVKLLKTPAADQTGSIKIKLEAAPVQL